jgi:hypothetical protein
MLIPLLWNHYSHAVLRFFWPAGVFNRHCSMDVKYMVLVGVVEAGGVQVPIYQLAVPCTYCI